MKEGEAQQGLSPELIEKIRTIQIRAQRQVTELLAGEYESAFKGQGMEFDHVRAYQPGDDARQLDWKVTARTGAPYVKQHREERELTVMLLVDVSASGQFGTLDKTKNELAAEIAALLACTAIHSNDRVGLLIFSDHVEHCIPPKKGRAHVWHVIREILTFQVTGKRTANIEAALLYLGKIVHRRAVVFVLSDFFDMHDGDTFAVLSRRHDATAIVIEDPREHTLPAMGMAVFEDAESGESIWVDTSDPLLRQHYAAEAIRRTHHRQACLRNAGMDELVVSTEVSFVDALTRFFHQREQQHYRRHRMR